MSKTKEEYYKEIEIVFEQRINEYVDSYRNYDEDEKEVKKKMQQYADQQTVEMKKRIEELEKAGEKATELIAHLKDQYGLNEVEEKAQKEVMKVFNYNGKW